MKSSDQDLGPLYADCAINLFPPVIREKICLDRDFISSLGLSSDAMLSIGKKGCSFDRSDLFKCIRQLFKNKSESLDIADSNGEIWNVRLKEAIFVEIEKGEENYLLAGFPYLSPSSKVRIDFFLDQAAACNLPLKTVSKWKKILNRRSLLDEEIKVLEEDFSKTPIELSKKVRHDVDAGSSEIETLSPNSKEYYFRLTGLTDETSSFQEYLENDLNGHIEQLVNWRPAEGLYWAFLLCAHHSVSLVLINYVRLIEIEDVTALYDFIEKEGDIWSKIGAIEVGLSILNEFPVIEQPLERLIRQVLDKESIENRRSFELLSALVVLIDGENARSNLLLGVSPSVRRLAAFSQASLLVRQIIPINVDVENLSKWAFGARGEDYYLKNMIDLREEPRWVPDSISSERLRHECIGRICNIAQLVGSDVLPDSFQDLLFSDTEGGVVNQMEFPYSSMPGPLEGKDDTGPAPPQDVLDAVHSQLSSKDVEPKSFTALVNACLIYRLDIKLSERAARLIRENRICLGHTENKEEFHAIIIGLACVAASSRSESLANELRVLIRVCRRSSGIDIDMHELCRIGMIISASNADLKSWAESVGQWFTELSFDDISYEDAEFLENQVMKLCKLAPELWVTLGRVKAALTAVLSSAKKGK